MRVLRYTRRAGRASVASALLVVTAAAFGAVGNVGIASAATSPRALVPASVRATGMLTIGTNLPFPPMEYFKPNNTTFTGADIDLINAIARGLGLKPKISNQDWEGLIPAVKSGRLDVTISGTGDFTDREKQVNFVDYLNDHPEVLLPKASAAHITTMLGLCGKLMGIQSGSVQVTAEAQASKNCVKHGKPAIKTQAFTEDSQGILALTSGRIQVYAEDGPVAHYEAAKIGGGNKFVVRFPHFLKTTIQYGIGVNKKLGRLTNAIQAELTVLIKNGTYLKILRRYHLQSLAVTKATINAAKVSSTAIS